MLAIYSQLSVSRALLNLMETRTESIVLNLFTVLNDETTSVYDFYFLLSISESTRDSFAASYLKLKTMKIIQLVTI